VVQREKREPGIPEAGPGQALLHPGQGHRLARRFQVIQGVIFFIGTVKGGKIVFGKKIVHCYDFFSNSYRSCFGEDTIVQRVE